MKTPIAKECPHCHNYTIDENFCDFCGKPVQKEVSIKERDLGDSLNQEDMNDY
jgi:hypothetical protein